MKKGLPVSDSWILSGVCFSKINTDVTDVSKIVRNCFICFQIGTKSINIITQPYLSDLGNLFFLHFLHFSSISNLSTKKISGPWNFIQLLFSETSNLWNFNPRTGWPEEGLYRIHHHASLHICRCSCAVDSNHMRLSSN